MVGLDIGHQPASRISWIVRLHVMDLAHFFLSLSGDLDVDGSTRVLLLLYVVALGGLFVRPHPLPPRRRLRHGPEERRQPERAEERHVPLSTGRPELLRLRPHLRGKVVDLPRTVSRAAVTFDAAGIFPTAVRDPLGHQFDSTYDIRAQEIVRISDPNGHQTEYRFDSSCRLRLMFKPGDSEAQPTVQFDYLDTALPMAVRTRSSSACRSVNCFPCRLG